MKRFRVTLLVICLILGWLGYADLRILLRNPEPVPISIGDLERNGAPREWLTVTGGHQDLLQAINMSGTMEIDSFLVPLKASPEASEIHVWFETRDPEIVDLLTSYYFHLDNDTERSEFLVENQFILTAERELTGMTAESLVADSNRQKLLELLEEMNVPASENVIFISEGKQPVKGRALFFSTMAVIGLLKLLFDLLKSPAKKIQPETECEKG